jgi:hypothetical protein
VLERVEAGQRHDAALDVPVGLEVRVDMLAVERADAAVLIVELHPGEIAEEAPVADAHVARHHEGAGEIVHDVAVGAVLDRARAAADIRHLDARIERDARQPAVEHEGRVHFAVPGIRVRGKCGCGEGSAEESEQNRARQMRCGCVDTHVRSFRSSEVPKPGPS